MYFEVIIPAADAQGQDHLLQVQADNWLDALRASLTKVGIDPMSVDRKMARITDAGVTVNARDGRIFKLRELGERPPTGSRPAVSAAAQPAAAPPAKAQPPAKPKEVSGVMAAPALGSATGSSKAVGFTNRATGSFMAIGATEISSNTAGRVLQDNARRTGQLRSIGPRTGTYAPIEDVFLEIGQIFGGTMEMEDTIDFVIDLCKRAIRSEHAMIFFASDDATHLYVATARSDNSAALLKVTVPIEHGFVATALREGVAITSDDPKRDPRYTAHFAKAGVEERSILCAPIEHEGRAFGVITMLNRRENDAYSPEEAGIASYIGQQFGHFISVHIHNTSSDDF